MYQFFSFLKVKKIIIFHFIAHSITHKIIFKLTDSIINSNLFNFDLFMFSIFNHLNYSMTNIGKGDQISHFIFGDLIAKGGYGRVYKCTIEGNPKNQIYALKVVPNSRSKSLENEKNILDELKNSGNYFPKKYDAACCASFYYIAMEYISFSLDKVTIPQDKTANIKVLSIALKTLECIKVLHEHDIIHRDIKPANFLIRKDNTMCLIDFGLSTHYRVNGKHIDEGYGGSVVGTALYQSIRSHRGEISSRRDDMESWIYLLLFLFKRSDTNSELWENCEDSEMPIKKDKMARFELNKIPPLGQIYENIRSLPFKTPPNYNDYREQILNEIKNSAKNEDEVNNMIETDLLDNGQEGCCTIC